MTPEETEARLLAEWLATPAGTPPPEGLPLEVVAAVYALRPDRAPAPRVSIDDVFARVQHGPFAAQGAEPARARQGARRAAGGGPDAGREGSRPVRKPRAWWSRPIVAVGLTAALAAVIVIPAAGVWLGTGGLRMADELARSEQVAAAPSAAEAPVTPAPSGGEVTTETKADAPAAASPRPVSTIPEAAPAAGGPGADGLVAAKPADGELAGGRAASTGSGSSAALESLGYAGDAAPPAEPAPPPPVTTPTAGPSTPPAAPAPTSAPQTTTAASTAGAGGGGKLAEMEEEGASATRDATVAREESRKDADAELDGWDWGAEKSERARTESTTQKAKAPAPQKKSASQTKSAPAAEAPAGAASADDEDKVASSRDRAVPRDYVASWYASRPDVAAVYAEAEALRAAGQADAAIAAYQTLSTHADAVVAQDAAWRAATVARQVGKNDTARSLVDRGLARSSANTAVRSNLLVVRGDLLAARGDRVGSEAAWAEAARLNDAR